MNSNIIMIFQQHIGYIHRNNTSKGILGSMPSQCKECTFLHLLINSKSPCFITITVFSDANFLTLLYIPKCTCFLSHTFLEYVILHLGQCLCSLSQNSYSILHIWHLEDILYELYHQINKTLLVNSWSILKYLGWKELKIQFLCTV